MCGKGLFGNALTLKKKNHKIIMQDKKFLDNLRKLQILREK